MTTSKLPTGEVVSVSEKQESWWQENEATGYLPPPLLAPDPDQPRKAIGGGDWQEFCTSIKTNGVREPIRVTPREKAPWVRLSEGDTSPFIIVSGHRRHKAACEMKLQAVPVVVKIYPDQAAYEDDADILNTGRKDLTALEDAYQIKRRRDRGDTWEQISSSRGMASLTCQMRLKLLNLAPDIKEKIDPVTRQGRRSDFPINVAQALGTLHEIEEKSYEEYCQRFGVNPEVDETEGESRFSFALQRAVLEQIGKANMKSTLAIEYIKNGRALKTNNRSTAVNARSTSNRQRMLKSVVQAPLKSSTSVWTRADIRTAFTGESVNKVEEFAKELRQAIAELERLYELVEDVQRAKEESLSAKPAVKFEPSEAKSLLDSDPEEAARIAEKYEVSLSNPSS